MPSLDGLHRRGTVRTRFESIILMDELCSSSLTQSPATND